jgi:hypothetical protein
LRQSLKVALRFRVCLGKQTVVDPSAIATVLNNTSSSKDAKLSRDVRLRKPQRFLNVANAQFTVREESDDSKPGLVGECLEEARDRADIQEVRIYHEMRIY